MNKSLENNNKRQKKTCSYDLQDSRERKRAIYSIQKAHHQRQREEEKGRMLKRKGRK